MKGAACTIPLLALVLRRTRALVHVPPTAWNPRTILSTPALAAWCESELLTRCCLWCVARLHVLWTEHAVHAAYNSEVEAARLLAAFASAM